MYTKITKSGGRSYLQLVEGHRDAAGKVRHRVVANLGRIDELTPQKLDPLINGLNRVLGRAENTASEVVSESAKAYGDVFALHELWKDLGFDSALRKALRSGRRKTDAEALIRAMVFNHLCAPDSKLGCLRWLETVAMPAMPETVTHQHLLRAMDALMDHADAVEEALARQIRPLVDQELTVVFYDLTTVRIHGEGAAEDDLRAFGMNKETGGIARQFVLGVVQTAEGLPLMHTSIPATSPRPRPCKGCYRASCSAFPSSASSLSPTAACEETQGAAMVFRVRELLIRQGTQAINALRGHLAEFGEIVPQGAANALKLIAIVEDPECNLPADAIPTLKGHCQVDGSAEAE